MKLSKQATRQIQEAIRQLQTGIDFIMQDKTRVVRITGLANMPEHTWTCGTGEVAGSICKEIGSDLTGIYNAKQTLLRLITPVEIET